MQKQKIILIIGIILGIIAVFMVRIYLEQQRRVMEQGAKKVMQDAQQMIASTQADQVTIIVATQDIPRGAVMSPESLGTTTVPSRFVQPQAVTSFDRIAGMMAVAPISKGEQITLSKLTYARDSGGLADVTPVGKRAITLSVDNIASLVGMIKAGDYADIIAMLPVPVQTPDGKQATEMAVVPLFQNVLVLAVGQEIGVISKEKGRYEKAEPRREISSLITVALSPQEANLIAFVQEQGKIRFVLRSPADSQIEPMQPANWDTLFQYIMPKETAKPEMKEELKPIVEYVDVYRGLSKERMPLSK